MGQDPFILFSAATTVVDALFSAVQGQGQGIAYCGALLFLPLVRFPLGRHSVAVVQGSEGGT